MELGDTFAVAAWAAAMLGDYPEAVRSAERGEALAGGEHGAMTFNLAWRAVAEFSLANWHAVVDEIVPRVVACSARGGTTPYFTAYAFGAGAFVHEARMDPAAAELVALLRRQAGLTEGVAAPLDDLARLGS